jgi:hypothetical protein
MPQGLQVFNPDATLRNDISDNLTRVLGSIKAPSTFGRVAWPYPAIVASRRMVTTVSNVPSAPNDVTTAYAFYDAAAGNVYYNQGDDKAPIDILFMTY